MNPLLQKVYRSFRAFGKGPLPRRLALIVGAVAIIGYWSYSTNRRPLPVVTETAQDKQAPDFFVQNANVIEFDANGFLKGNLTAQEISHYPHNGITRLKYPNMWTYRKDKNPWQTMADKGRILPDGETLELSKHVVIIQIDETDKPVQRLDTEFLTVYSAKDYAETDEPVRLTNPTNVVNAVGMLAFYQRDFIQLKSRVKGIHESRQNP